MGSARVLQNDGYFVKCELSGQLPFLVCKVIKYVEYELSFSYKCRCEIVVGYATDFQKGFYFVKCD